MASHTNLSLHQTNSASQVVPEVTNRAGPIGGQPCFVRLIPELSVAALKSKQDKELALWYCLRAVNYWGSGSLEKKAALDALVSEFGYTPRTVYRLLSKGEGKFWHTYQVKGSPQIKIEGLETVARYLDTSGLKRFINVAITDFDTLGKRRSWLYASFFSPSEKKAKPISRATLTEATGVKCRQQRRYDKKAHIKRVANFAVESDCNGKLCRIPQVVCGKHQTWTQQRRLPNTYYCNADNSRQGMLRRVTKKLRASFNKGEGVLRYFFNPRTLAKAIKKDEESFYLVNNSQRLIPGRLEWCRVMKI